jgi:hypothetical protein
MYVCICMYMDMDTCIYMCHMGIYMYRVYLCFMSDMLCTTTFMRTYWHRCLDGYSGNRDSLANRNHIIALHQQVVDFEERIQMSKSDSDTLFRLIMDDVKVSYSILSNHIYLAWSSYLNSFLVAM